jgi:hypothetical protein
VFPKIGGEIMDKEKWVKSILSNDENSSDEELVTQLMSEGKMTEEEAKKWVSKRDFYLNNIVMDDGTIYDPRTRDFVICELCQRAFEPEEINGVRKLKEFKGYTVDLRLQQFRKMELGKQLDFIDFNSPKGRKLLAQMHERVTR